MGRREIITVWLGALVAALCLGGCEEPARRDGDSTPLQEQRSAPEGRRHPPPAADPPAWADAITGAEIDESAVTRTIHVDAAKGDDSAAGGSRAKPLRTLTAAVEVASTFLRNGQGVRIRLAPGTYREEVTIRPAEAAGPPLIIEGERKGAVVLSGSDDWSDPERWQPVEGHPGILAASWPRRWGDPRVHVSGAPEGDHPPRDVRGWAPDDGTAVIEWQPPAGLPDLAGYRIERKDTAFRPQEHETPWRPVTELGAATGRLVDESVEGGGVSEIRLYQYRVVALDAGGRSCGTSRIVTIEPGTPDGAWRAAAVGRRREMVFVDGELLRQVLSRDALEPGTFYVDEGSPGAEGDGRLYLALPLDAARGQVRIEVALRAAGRRDAGLLEIRGEANLVLRNLLVRHHAGAPWSAAAVHVADCRNVLIEDCTFRWNNAAGLRLRGASAVTLRRCAAEHNGTCGLRCEASTNLLADDLTLAHNNWRGEWGGVTAGRVAAFKARHAMGDGVFRRLEVRENACTGVWLDDAAPRVLLDGLRAVGNRRAGLAVTFSQGPVVVREAVIARNDGAGLLLAQSAGGLLADSTLYGNGRSQIEVAGPTAAGRAHPTIARPVHGDVRDWAWRESAVVSTDAAAPPVRAPVDPVFLRTLRSNRNLWFGPDEDGTFRLGDMDLPLEAWQQVTGEDVGSRFLDPRFENAEALDFRPRGDSPLRERDAWSRRAAMAGSLERLAAFRAVRAHATTAPPWPALADAANLQWYIVDLGKAANRPLTGEGAWLGDPFPELAPGRRMIHGVPFTVLDGEENGGRAAVVLRSGRPQTAGVQPLPAEVTVPVGRTARTVYVLHGCAGAARFVPVGRYDLVYEDGTTAGIDVVALGEAPAAPSRLAERERLATIQDWRPALPQFAGERGRRAMIVDSDDPASRIRYLYTLRWPNPHPEKPIRAIRLRAVGPDREVTLGILAITLRLSDAPAP